MAYTEKASIYCIQWSSAHLCQQFRQIKKNQMMGKKAGMQIGAYRKMEQKLSQFMLIGCQDGSVKLLQLVLNSSPNLKSNDLDRNKTSQPYYAK